MRSKGAAWAVSLAALALWEALGRSSGSSIPVPTAIARTLASRAIDGSLVHAAAESAWRLAVGYAVAVVVGIPLGFFVARERAMGGGVRALLLALGGVPSICWLPVSVVLFGFSEWTVLSIVVIGAAIPIATATDASLRQLPPELERSARALGASSWALAFEVLLPGALPGIANGAKLAYGFALRSLIAGELLFVSGGFGRLLELGRDLGDLSLVFGVVLLIIVMGQLVDRLVFRRLDRLIARRWGLEVRA